MPLPLVPIIIAVVAGGGVIAYKKGALTPILQSVKTTAPSGAPVQIVAPVSGTIQSVLAAPIHAGLKIIMPSPNVDPTTPSVITSGGASNLTVESNQDVQRALNTLGYANPALTVDGVIGPMSAQAIKNFETSKNMPSDGTVSASLKLALEIALNTLASGNNNLSNNQSVLNAKAPPANLTTTKGVQTALNQLGASPQLTEDGILGPATTAAITAFQIKHGLTADGIAGPQTCTAIQIALTAQHNDNVTSPAFI